MTITPPAGGLLDQISVGVLTSSVPREVIDEAVAEHGKQAKRSDGKFPPHVMVYFAMALALFSDQDYEEVITRLSEPLARWGCWEWEAPTTGGLTQARQRLGLQVMETIFDHIAAEPVADALTRGAWPAHLRLAGIDGMVFDVPDSRANAAEFGYGGGSATPSAFLRCGWSPSTSAVPTPLWPRSWARAVGARAPGSSLWPVPSTGVWTRTWWCWPTVTSTPLPTSPRPLTPAGTAVVARQGRPGVAGGGVLGRWILHLAGDGPTLG